MKAVILGNGASLKDYKEAEFKDAFVIAVNNTYHEYEQRFKKSPRFDLVIAQDRYDKFAAQKPEILKVPEEVEMQFVSPTWQGFCNRRGNASVVVSSHHANSFERVADPKIKHLHGHTSVVGALLEAIKRGYNELYLFGHDCSPGHMLNNANALNRAVRELNFVHQCAEKKGGYLKLAPSSWLWNYKHPEGLPFVVEKYEKPKTARSRKKVEE